MDRVIDANMKFPWTYICRALAGVDTAVWDLYGPGWGVTINPAWIEKASYLKSERQAKR